nr:AAA family ATPase [Thermoanaerobaculia bacterium]
MRLSQELEISLTVALSEAARLGHEYAGTEHLLYALTLDRRVSTVLAAAGANVHRLKARLADYLDHELVGVASSGGEPRLSLALERVFAQASRQVEGAGREQVDGSDLLVALFTETEAHAVEFLKAEGVSRFDVVAYLAHGIRKNGDVPSTGRRPLTGAPEPAEDLEEEGDTSPAADPLSTFTQDLTALAREGRLDPLIGRGQEVQRCFQVLQRRTKNNPLLVGDPGVGKTALVEGLAVKIAEGEVPAPFKESRLFRLDLGSLLAGTRYRGDFENRLKLVLASLADSERASERPILFIDEIHTVIGAGSTGRGTLDAS